MIGVGTQWFLNTDHVPLLAANAGEVLRSAGERFAVVDPVDHEDSLELVAAGELTVAITEANHLVTARDRGLDLVCIGRYMQTVGGVLVPAGAAPTDGMVIGYPDAPGRRGDTLLRTALGVQFTSVDTHYWFAQKLLDGEIDAGFFAFANQEIPWLAARGFAASVLDITQHGLPDFAHLLLVTRASVATSATARLVRRAVVEGIGLVRRDPAVWKQTLLRARPHLDELGFDEIYDRTLTCFTPQLDLGGAYWDAFCEAFRSLKLIGPSVVGRDCWTDGRPTGETLW